MAVKSWWLRVRPPLWARWACSLLVGAAVIVALVLYVDHHNGNSLAHISAKAAAQENQQARIVVGQDQRPHTAKLAAGALPRTVVTAAVRANIRHRLKQGTIEGQLESVGCRQSGREGAKLGFHCTAVVSHSRYPYLAVADPAARQLVYCKRDLPPIPSENIPVSARCRLPKS
jgi:hypothetical protein